MACGAQKSKKQGGGICSRPNGWGTDHPGTGKCKSHGGASHGRPIIHGRYSKIVRPRLRALIEEFDNDPDPLNLLPELSLLRSLIVDFVERYDEFAEALITWHESFHTGEAPPKPRQILDIVSAATYIDKIGSLSDRIQKQKAEGSISMVALNEILEQHGVELVGAVRETINDPALQAAVVEAVERRWGAIPAPAAARKPA